MLICAILIADSGSEWIVQIVVGARIEEIIFNRKD